MSRPPGARHGQVPGLPGLPRYARGCRFARRVLPARLPVPLTAVPGVIAPETAVISRLRPDSAGTPGHGQGQPAWPPERYRNHIPDPRRAEDAPYFGTPGIRDVLTPDDTIRVPRPPQIRSTPPAA